MEVGKWREGLRGSVVAGSVWESRMKVDQVKGGIKVFNAGDQDNNSEETTSNGVAATTPRTRLKKGSGVGGGGGAVGAGKRKTWKSDSFEGTEKNPIGAIQISKGKTESLKNSSDDQKSPTIRRLRSDANPNGIRKPRNELVKSASDLGGISEVNERNSGNQLRKVKSESSKNSDGDGDGDAIQLRKAAESETKNAASDESDRPVEVVEKNPVENESIGSDENCKEFGVCKEMVVSSSNVNVDGMLHDDDDVVDQDGGDDDDDDGDHELEEDVDEGIEVEIETKRVDDVKQVNAAARPPCPPPPPPPPPQDKLTTNVVNEEKVVKVNEVKKIFHSPPPQEKLTTKVVNEDKVVKVNEVKKILHLDRKEVKKLHHFNQKPEVPISLNLRKSPPVIKRATLHTNVPKYTPSPSASNGYHTSFPAETHHSRLQSLVDLIMWKDISRSVFVFGIGTFVILSSSYTRDINISFISVISYMGLLYLAAIFLFKSILCRGAVEVDNANYVVGEQEAIWLLRLILPYLNELLLKIKALFSGDPATTIKLAVLLFVLARCGSSITIWTMSKVGFFGVFTVPKVCSLYSAQIAVYAKFWVRRFRDVWESCTHKKAVTIGIFLLVWNLCSVVARIWAAFILVVAFRYYQQKLVTEEWVEESVDDVGVEEEEEEAWEGVGQRQGHVDVTKQKKGF